MSNKEIVEGFLKDNPQGLSIQDISNKTILSRNTVKIILVELEAKKKIKIRNVGQAKLHYWVIKNG